MTLVSKKIHLNELKRPYYTFTIVKSLFLLATFNHHFQYINYIEYVYYCLNGVANFVLRVIYSETVY